ncbi:CPBP family intramembrane glutamic endopeptidase [Roseateles chitinivorans]|uniref:CPBP family intramembrane glutamic endopeptidase n=1 Tax=Roseateles chitinivorans TaxID=2917965 RepID=UPI003D67E59E
MVQTLMLIVLAIAIRRAAGWLCAPLWETLIDCNEWLTRTAVTHLDLLVQAGVAVTVLAWLRCGPPLRELFAVRPRTTLGLLAAGASLPVLATVIALPDAFRSGHLAPLSPMSWQFWLGGVMPLAAAALHEELLHRALFLPLFNRLLLNEWAGAVASALLFAAVHPPERAIAVFPAGLLLAVVYLRTRSIVCTTVLHLAMNISLSTITGTDFTHSRFIASEVFVGARPLFGAVIFAFAVMFEWGWRRSVDGREPRLTHPPNERAGTAFPERTSV